MVSQRHAVVKHYFSASRSQPFQAYSKPIVGSPKRSRTRRSTAASRARAERLGGHAAAKSRELLAGLTRQRRGRLAVQRRARLLQQLRVEGRQPIDRRA